MFYFLRRTILENNIKQRRKSRHLSQAELAKMASVTRQTIIAIENNKYDPSLSLAFKLADILHIPMDKLFLYRKEDQND